MRPTSLGALLPFALVFVPTVPGQSAPARSRTEVRVDPRVELFAIVNRLAGAEEYCKAADSDYVRAVDARFAPFKMHEAVEAALTVRTLAGISYNAVPGLAVYLDDAASLKPIVPLKPLPPGLDRRWGMPTANPEWFLERLRAFAKETSFSEFFASQRAYYDRIESAFRAGASSEDFVGWFDGFFGERPRARFTLIPAPLHGPNNYGCAATGPDGVENLVQVLGVGAYDASGAPVLGDGFASLLVHEMAHSYCNPLVDAHAKDLDAAGDALFNATESAMRPQAYASGHLLLGESLVRMTCVMHKLERHGEAAAAAELAYQETRSFLWTPDLVAAARRFRASPPASKRFADFMPEIVRAIQDAAKRDWKSYEPPFRGPVNAAFTERSWAKRAWIVTPASEPPALERYLGQMFDQFFVKRGAERAGAAEITPENAKGRPLVIYGSPSTNALAKRVCDAAGWKIAADSITLGERKFDGAGLVLIACWPSPLDPSVPAVVYTSHDDAALVGVNSTNHGVDDWLVARRVEGGKNAFVARGNFPKTLANEWRPLAAK